MGRRRPNQTTIVGVSGIKSQHSNSAETSGALPQIPRIRPGAGTPGARRRDWAVFVVFAIYEAYRLWAHDMWRDEIQSWMIAVVSTWPWDVIELTRYEGHPPLWFLYLWPFTRITADPEFLKVAYAIVMFPVIGLIALKSPFRLYEKLLLLVGYYILFEYGTIHKHYGLTVLLVFTIAVSWRRLVRHPLIAALLLGLLANTNYFGAVMSILLCVLVLVADRGRRKQGWIIAAVYAPFLIVAAITMARASELAAPSFGTWHLAWEPGRAFRALGSAALAFVPITDPTAGHYWNPHLLRQAAAGLALPVMVLASITLWRNRLVWLAFLAFFAAVMALFYTRYSGASWHSGTIFVFFIVCVWLIGRADDRGPAARAALLVLLLLNAYGGLNAAVWSTQRPISNARRAADWIRAEGLAGGFWIGTPDYTASTVAGYLQRRFRYPECGCRGTYIKWGERRHLSRAEALRKALATAQRRRPAESYLVTNYRLSRKTLSGPGSIVSLKEFRGSEDDEDYYLYLLPAAGAKTPRRLRGADSPPRQ